MVASQTLLHHAAPTACRPPSNHNCPARRACSVATCVTVSSCLAQGDTNREYFTNTACDVLRTVTPRRSPLPSAGCRTCTRVAIADIARSTCSRASRFTPRCRRASSLQRIEHMTRPVQQFLYSTHAFLLRYHSSSSATTPLLMATLHLHHSPVPPMHHPSSTLLLSHGVHHDTCTIRCAAHIAALGLTPGQPIPRQ
jgi:hypothetical protein